MKKIIKIIIILAVIGGIGFVGYTKINEKVDKKIETYKVSQRDLHEYVEETGTVKSSSDRKVYSEVQDKVLQAKFKVGDKVEKGDILVIIDQTNIKSEINVNKAKIQELQSAYKHSTKPVDKEKTDSIDANIKNIEIELADIRRMISNKDKLYEQGAISSDEYISLQKQEKTLENQLVSAQNELALLKKDVSGDLKNQYNAQIKQVNEATSLLETKKQKHVIQAPISGVITEKYIKEGSYVTPSTVLFEISNANDLYVEADILVSEIKGLEVGNKVTVYNEDLGLELSECAVSKIYPKAHTKISDLGIEQKRVKIEISLIGDTSIIKEGYDVDVRIITNISKNALVVNKSDVYEEDGKQYIDVLIDDKVHKREVIIGIEESENVEIKKGVELGDYIVKNA